MRTSRTVFLIDDDDAVCHALSVFLEGAGYRVRSFSSAEAFLEKADSALEGVMVLDQRMTGMSGLELQAELNRRGANPSIIFISGHGDVQMSVKAIKAGAINFLEKPFNNDELLTSIREAFSYADKSKKQRNMTTEIRKCHASLTDREKEVLQHVVAGMSNRHLAELLGVSDRTVEVHRSRGMKKMGAASLPDLVRKYTLCQKAG
ncbi:MAG: DNA-binding response regulator [Gammaproteobacteria bacterium]|nr:MAG: DNA-binding response regulator [Gammaproteobacteria bacterium]